MPETITDELIRLIKRWKARGITTACLSEQTRQRLFHPVPPRRRAAQTSSESSAGDGRTQSGRRAAATNASTPVAAPQRTARPVPTSAEAAPAAVGKMDWDALQQCVSDCTRCPLHEGRTQTVFGDGARDAGLMFIGEGPGVDEDREGIPFVGRAGQLLTRMIQAMQFDRSEVYIANIVKCHPPRNRNPADAEAASCLPYLERQIALLKPDVIVLLGAVPLRYLLQEKGINRLHGQWLEYKGIAVMPTFHPAYLLRVPDRKADAWKDLQKVMEKLGKDPRETLRRMKQGNQ